jgi:hypothetical protein
VGNQNQHKSKTQHKELERMRKAKDKVARRQSKKDEKSETETAGTPD